MREGNGHEGARAARDTTKARLEAKRSRKGTTFKMLTRVEEFLKGAND